MSGLAFDTLSFARRLQGAGFTREQAEALADEQGRLVDERLVTKADVEATRVLLVRDIEIVRSDLKHDIEMLRSELKRDIEMLRSDLKHDIEALRLQTSADIERLRSELLRWMVGIAGAQTLTIIAAVVGLMRWSH